VRFDPDTGLLLESTWSRFKRFLWKLMTSREFKDDYNGPGEEARAPDQLEGNAKYCEACAAGEPCAERDAEEAEVAERVREAAEAEEAQGKMA
jgi:hypothetical protein